MTQINIEELYKEEYERAAKNLAEDIDFKFLSDYLVDSGWTRVEIEFESRHQSVDIILWVENNCQGKHTKRGGTFLFENSKDALLFELKWL